MPIQFVGATAGEAEAIVSVLCSVVALMECNCCQGPALLSHNFPAVCDNFFCRRPHSLHLPGVGSPGGAAPSRPCSPGRPGKPLRTCLACQLDA